MNRFEHLHTNDTLAFEIDLEYLLPHLVVILDIHDCLLPLAGRNSAVEKDVDLTIGSALHLRQEEVCQCEADETSASPDVTTFATKIGALRTC